MATTKKTAVTYDEDSIEVLDFPDAVRKKTSFYIGPTDESGVWTIVREAADNAVDEALAERNNFVHIHFGKTDKGLPEYWVRDNGAGIPVKPKKFKDVTLPTIEAILTRLHSSGKFHDKAYSIARGSHGLGLKATNALSTEFEVFTFRDGSWYSLQYSKGIKTRDLKKCRPPVSPASGKPIASGTVIRVVPDKSIFSSLNFSPALAIEWAQVSAYFTPKFKVLLTSHKGSKKEIYYPEGPKAFTKDRVEKLKCTPLSPDVFVYSSALCDCVAQFTDYDGTELKAFTNGLHNAEGGVHYNAFFAALKKAIDPHIKVRQEFTINELKEGVVGLINAKLSAPNFDSQTKEKLVDDRADKPLHAMLVTELTKFFASNKALAHKICARCFELKNLKNKFVASKNVLKEIRRVTSLGFPSKATTSPHAKPDQRELFLVEGDSAGGIARQARDGSYQEILPLRGKILNALKHTDERVLLSEEVLNILAMIGFDPKASNPYDKLRVGKIICLSDPDPDGPLHGDTPLNVATFENDDVKGEPIWHRVTMAELATQEWLNRKYYVNAYNGKTFVLAQAHSSRVTEYGSKQITLGFENGKKIICSPSHQFALASQRYDQRVVGQLANGMQMIRADRLKTGDRLCQPLEMKGPNASNSKMTVLGITRCKVSQCDPTPWYCLTVPTYHNFVLECGVVSKNCHINSLILTLLFKYLPDLFKRGIVYAAQTPEFYSVAGGRLFGGSSPSDVEAQLARAKVKGTARHIKGYGEIDPDILRVLAFEPSTRRVVKITSLEKSRNQEFIDIMGEGSAGRRILLGI
jgi:DNA gyrase subunit B